MKTILSSIFVLAGLSFSQTVFDPARRGSDEFKPTPKEVALRIAASDYVVIGTVAQIGFVPTRLFKQQRAEIEQMERDGRDIAEKVAKSDWGSQIILYTVRVESTLCRQSDFTPGSSGLAQIREIYLFNPIGPRLDAGFREEYLREGARYLFFLGKAAELEEKMAKFDLDPKKTYHEVLNHAAGAIQLPTESERATPVSFKPFGYESDVDLATPVLSTTAALCEAIKPANVYEKIDGLERLKSSPDLEMRANAEAALRLLDAARK